MCPCHAHNNPILAPQSMVPLGTLRPAVVAWCVALVISDASTANPRYTTTKLSDIVGQQGLDESSESAHDSFERIGSRCFEGDAKNTNGGDLCNHGGHGSSDQIAWAPVGDAVDLGELADRVSDALVASVGVDGDVLGSTSASPGSSPSGCSAQANGALSNQGEHAQEEGVAEAAQRDHVGKETTLEVGVGRACGEGENQRMCNQDEECCNSSCGICAPRGHSCLQIACGVLSRGGASKSSLDGTASASRQLRARRLKALVSSVRKDESMPPKDRLKQLQRRMPELFEHVSLRGFKRLIAQITDEGAQANHNAEAPATAATTAKPRVDHTNGVSEGTLETSTARPERRVSQKTVDQEERKVGSQQNLALHRSKATPQPKVNANTHVHDGKPPVAKSLQPNHGARQRKQRAEGKVKDSARASSSSRLRSSLDGRKPTAAGGKGLDTSVTTTMERPHQQRHRGAEASGTDPHPQHADVAHRGRQGSSTSASLSSSTSGRFSFEYPSVWDVGKPVTGLADIDSASAMNGLLHRKISEDMKEESDRLGRERAAVLQAAMGLLWKGYSDHAWGYDEVKPMGKKGTNNWGGMGVTLVDSLDTLWLMGLTEEFYNGRDWVRDHMTFDNAGMVSVFETTIRVLGGLLSAFELSREKVFLHRAKELADRLLPAFSSTTGIPYKSVNLSTGKVAGMGSSVLSEVGTLQLEFRYLSRELGDDKYADKAMQAFDFLAGKTVSHGLFPIRINPNTGKFTSTQVTFGALGDSFYEYLLKVWIQGGRREGNYRRLYDDAMDGVDKLLVQKTRGLTYLSEWNGSTRQQQHRMDHLACFMAGNLALGSMTSQDPVRAARDLKTGKALAYTCHQMYMMTATGLSPETVDFTGSGGMRARARARFYILRPETLESFFVLHQLTGDPVYREWGWDIFRAIERHCRVGVGYGSHPDVENPTREPDDHMESFFPAETLKYLYLLMQPDHPVDLMKYTINTEAHPLRVFSFDSDRGGQILS